MKKEQIKAFTLVELIIVITILAILATIGFMSYQSYTIDARDGKRVTDLGEIRNGLEIYQTKKSVLPAPDAQVITIANGLNTLVYQGYAGASVLQTLRASDIKDPKENIAYTYSTNGDYTKFQLLSMLENGTTVNLSQTPIHITYAANNYTGRKTYVVGNKLGVFLDNSTNTPIQEIVPGNIDLGGAHSGTIFKVVLANTTTNSGVITGTGVSLYNTIIDLTKITPQAVIIKVGEQTNPGLSCKDILDKGGSNGDGTYWIKPDTNPAFQVYCDMTTDGGGWTLVWKSLTNPGINNNSVNIIGLQNLTIDGFSKLSDSIINQIKSSSNTDVVGYRIDQSANICTTKKSSYISSACSFNWQAGGVTRGSGCDKSKISYLGTWFVDSYISWCLTSNGWSSTIFCAHDGTNYGGLHFHGSFSTTCHHSYSQTMVWVK